MATAYIPKPGDRKKNQDRYNAATSGSQSISDYLSSNGVKSDGSYTDKSTGRYYTTVTESNGNKSTGYIKDGVSYYSNGTPINTGASVTDSTGKTWTKGGNSINSYLAENGVSTSERYGQMGDQLSYNPYQDQVDYYKSAYEDLENQIREQNRLAVEQGTNRLEAQKANINQAADENARQAYVQYMQSQKALPQQLAIQGVSGGATETANLGLQTAYQNNVNAINQNKANRLQEIDNAIVDLQNTGDLSTVEQVLANNQAALDAYMNTFDKGVGYNQWANQFNANRQDTMADQAYRDKVYADQMTQQQWENDWFEKQYNDEKKQAELDRTLQGYYNGYYDAGYTSAQTGIPIEYLYDTKSERELMAKLERANTQSLINNRNYQTQKEVKEQAEEESNNKYYNLATQINNQYANNTIGKNAGDAVIMDDGNGGYTLNPNISRGSYLDLVIARAFDSNMSDNEVKTFLNNLGISDSDISRVAKYYLADESAK
jgi:hypothetical protein